MYFICASFMFQDLFTRLIHEIRRNRERLYAIWTRWRKPLTLSPMGCLWGTPRKCTPYPNQFYIDTANRVSQHEQFTRRSSRHMRICNVQRILNHDSLNGIRKFFREFFNLINSIKDISRDFLLQLTTRCHTLSIIFLPFIQLYVLNLYCMNYYGD